MFSGSSGPRVRTYSLISHVETRVFNQLVQTGIASCAHVIPPFTVSSLALLSRRLKTLKRGTSPHSLPGACTPAVVRGVQDGLAAQSPESPLRTKLPFPGMRPCSVPRRLPPHFAWTRHPKQWAAPLSDPRTAASVSCNVKNLCTRNEVQLVSVRRKHQCVIFRVSRKSDL